MLEKAYRDATVIEPDHLVRSELPMKSLSKPAAYLGNRKPNLPNAHSHQARGGDYVYSPDHYVLGAFVKAPEMSVKKTGHLPKKSIAEI